MFPHPGKKPSGEPISDAERDICQQLGRNAEARLRKASTCQLATLTTGLGCGGYCKNSQPAGLTKNASNPGEWANTIAHDESQPLGYNDPQNGPEVNGKYAYHWRRICAGPT